MKSLENKTAAITGAGSGIGRATAITLARYGCNLALADVDSAALNQTQELLANSGVTISTHCVDVSQREAVAKFANDVAKQHGSIHIIINNAGIALSANVEDMPYAELERVMDINFYGVVYGCKEFLPYLKQADEGHIINVSSMFGLISVASQSAYNASKFAVRGFSEALNQELLIEQSTVHCSCIYPGFIKTAIMDNARFVGMEKFGIEKHKAANDFASTTNTSAEQVAREIVDAILHNRPRVLIGRDATWMDRMQRMFPAGYQHIMAKIRRKQYRLQ